MVLASDDFPEPLAPSKARPLPAGRENEISRAITRLEPGGTTATCWTQRLLAGERSVTAGAGGEGMPFSVVSRRLTASRAAMSCFQVPRTISIGASARPMMIDEAIMMPPLALSPTTRAAPTQRTADWRV